MPVTVTLKGEGMSFEREVDEGTALQIMEVAIEGEPTESAEAEAETPDELPDSFFRRLSDRQEAYVRVLLEDGGWVSNEEVRQRMEDEYGEQTNGPQAIAGVRAGFTRKYGDDFNIDERSWKSDKGQNVYRLNADYIEEVEQGLARLDEE